MWKQTLSLIFLLIYVIQGGDVIELDESNFEHETQIASGATTGDWFIEFYAPWCGHCKKLAPVWEEVATDLKGQINVAKVDVTNNRGLGSRFGIKGFPTLLFFKRGKMIKYSGPRKKDSLVEFASSANPEDSIPGPPSVGSNILTKAVSVIEDVIRLVMDKTIASIVIAIIGGMFGFLIGLIVGGPNYSPPPTYQNKQYVRVEQPQPQPPPPKENDGDDDDGDDNEDDNDNEDDTQQVDNAEPKDPKTKKDD